MKPGERLQKLRQESYDPKTGRKPITQANLVKLTQEILEDLGYQYCPTAKSVSTWEIGTAKPRVRDENIRISLIVMASILFDCSNGRNSIESIVNWLESFGIPGITISDLHRTPFSSRIIYSHEENVIYEKGTIIKLKLREKELATLLYDWKIVHAASQSIFIYLPVVESKIRDMSLEISIKNKIEREKDKEMLITFWNQFIENKISLAFDEFQRLMSSKNDININISDIISSSGKSYIWHMIYRLNENSNDLNLHLAIINRVMSLKALIDQVLVTTDLIISDIAIAIKGKY